MSNNRGNISLARKLALKDIAKHIRNKAIKLKDNHIYPVYVWRNGDVEIRGDYLRDSITEWIGYYFYTASSLRTNLEITKLNKELGI